jgi:hypothetical protein
MPSVRRHVRIVLDGVKVEIETNALDLARAEREGEGDTVRGMRTIYEACLRNRVEHVAPNKFDAFLSSIDAIDDLDDEEQQGDLAVDETDPTRRTGGELSP